MILYAFSLYDTKVETYSPPFFVAHRAMAYRMVSELAGDLGTSVGRHPNDYVLYELGVFDDSKGSMQPSPTPYNHGHAASFLPRPQVQLPLEQEVR